MSLSHLSRRQFGAGAAALAVAGTARASGVTCSAQWPQWADDLRADLEAMARELTRTLKPWSGPKRVLAPEEFGYDPASGALATLAIQAAVDAAAERGGGTVRLANGDYVSGTIDLRSNIRLEVGKNARLLASLDLDDYPERIAARPTVMDSNMGMNQSLIFAEGCENISICGKGLIDGRGSRENFPGEETVGATPGRPFLIRIIDCKRVHVKDVNLKDAACWMQNYLNCEDVLIEKIHVENQANFNNDGCDIDSCRRVIVRNCFISSGDDALCFKGAGQRPMHDVLVENCRLYSSCNAIKFGTDSQGDFRRVLARHLEIGGPSDDMRAMRPRRADSGVSWEVVDGCTMENILTTDIRIVRAKSPIFLRLGDRGRVRPDEEKPAPGNLRRLVFDKIEGGDNGPRGSYFIGIPEKRIEDVAIRDLNLETDPTDEPALDENAIPEMHSDYPDAHMIEGVTPAYGLWARHIDGLTLTHVNFTLTAPDPRPTIKAETDALRICVE